MKTSDDQNQTTSPLGEFLVGQIDSMDSEIARLRIENRKLRALVTRITDAAQALAAEHSDPGTEALAAIHCGRNFIYG